MKRDQPITVFCADASEAFAQCAQNQEGRVMVSGPGTLTFHRLIAEHGAGVFKTLYVPLALKGSFKTPAGGEVRFGDVIENIPS